MYFASTKSHPPTRKKKHKQRLRSNWKIVKHTDISRFQAEYKTSIEAFFISTILFFSFFLHYTSVQNSQIFHRFIKSLFCLWKLRTCTVGVWCVYVCNRSRHPRPILADVRFSNAPLLRKKTTSFIHKI